MSIILQREMRHVEQELLTLSAVVEENTQLAVRAVLARDSHLADRVLERDTEVDEREVELEEECLKIIALHQPVATDLRLLVAVLKINSDLERVGDSAVAIGRCALRLNVLPELPLPRDLKVLADSALQLFGRSLDCFVRMDGALARQVCEGDAEVDAIYDRISDELRQQVTGNPALIDQTLLLYRVIRSLERVGDHASNIAEDVLYILEGGIVRHRKNGDAQPAKVRRTSL